MIKSILWMGLFLLSFAACSDKSDSDDGQPEEVFDVVYNGKVLENNSKITITDVSTENGFPQMSFIVGVKNNREGAIQVAVTKQEITISESSSNDFCWGDKCWPSTVFKAPAIAIAGGATENSFHASYVPQKAGTTKVKYIFAEEAANGFSRSVEVTYNYTLK